MQTNNTALNTIFSTHKVDRYEAPYSSSPQIIYIRCSNCDITALKTALDNQAAIVAQTDIITTNQLSNNQFESTKVQFSPNPFTYRLSIITNDKIVSYQLIDLLGKNILTTGSKTVFDNKLEQLVSGTYILNLGFENGTTSNHKILKN